MELQKDLQEYTTQIIYTSAFNEEFTDAVIEINDEESDKCRHIKINLAGSFSNYMNGAGECVDAVTTSLGLEKANSDEYRGEMFFVRITQDSKYYDELKKGAYILVESRGTKGRPVANYHELRMKYGESNWS